MKIEEKLTKSIIVSELENLDPITIMIDEKGEGAAQITIKCWDKSWTAYWGGMGSGVKQFFSRVDVCYLVNCFDRGIRDSTNTLDTTSMQKVFETKVKERILERVRDGYTKYPEHRTIWNECSQVDLEEIEPDHPYDSWHIFDDWRVTSCDWKIIWSDQEDFDDWMCNNVPEEYEPNYEYQYLSRIVEVVKKVLSEEV